MNGQGKEKGKKQGMGKVTAQGMGKVKRQGIEKVKGELTCEAVFAHACPEEQTGYTLPSSIMKSFSKRNNNFMSMYSQALQYTVPSYLLTHLAIN